MAATSITFEATTEDQRPIEALVDVIEKRTDILRETTRDAVIATAITILKSLRAITRKGKAKVKIAAQVEPKLSIAVALAPELHVGFTGRNHKVCVRDAAGKRREDIKPWLRVAPAELPSAQVYRITLSGDRVAAWTFQRRTSYMIARSLDSATKIAEQRFSKVAVKSSGLAKDALSRAMQLTSSKPASLVSKRAAILSEKNLVRVDNESSGFASGTYAISISDDLNYATEALKGGAAAVDTAMARAANSVTGYMNAFMNKHAPFFFKDQKMEEFRAPFPDGCFDPDTDMLIPAA